MVGFTAEVTLEELVAIGKKHNLPVMEDLGSGAFIDLSRYGLPKEPIVAERIQAGANIVTFSGDKILGGPQAGLMVGKKDLIGRMNKNHLQRALRCGKLTLAALEATLRRYRQSPDIVEEFHAPSLYPIGRRNSRDRRTVAAQASSGARRRIPDPARRLNGANRQRRSADRRATDGRHQRRAHPKLSANAIAQNFAPPIPPIIGRIKDDRFLLDLRTIFDANDLIPNFDE